MSAGIPAYSQYHTPRSAGAMTPNSIYVSLLFAAQTRIFAARLNEVSCD